MTQEDNIYKVLLLGEGGVGKTSLTKQFVYNRFDDKYIKTLGTNISKKDIILGKEVGNAKVKGSGFRLRPYGPGEPG